MSLENRFAGLGIGNGVNFSQFEKEKIVDALVEVGITASMADTYDTLKSKILAAEQSGVVILPGSVNKAIPNGIYNTGGGFVQGDSNLVGDNIKPGISIFGVSSTMATQGAQTITPGTNNKTISSGRYLTGTQTILGDSDLISANIKAGKSIFGVNGDSNVVDTSAGTAAANKILSGYKAYVDGSLITGSIPSKGAQTYTPGTSNQSISAGQYLSGTQTIQGDSDLVAGNIKKGVNIFGIAGNYLPSALVGSDFNEDLSFTPYDLIGTYDYFTVALPGNYRFHGVFEGTNGWPMTYMRLKQNGVTKFAIETDLDEGNSPYPFDTNFQLEAGTVQLEINAHYTGGTVTATLSFDVENITGPLVSKLI